MSARLERDAGRRAVDDAADRRPVALAPGGEAEDRAEAVAGHGRLLDDGDVGRVHRLHADDVIAAIDVMHLAGDARAQIAQEIEPAPPTSSIVTLRFSGELYWFHLRM